MCTATLIFREQVVNLTRIKCFDRGEYMKKRERDRINLSFLEQFGDTKGLCKVCGQPTDKHYYSYCKHCYKEVFTRADHYEENSFLENTWQDNLTE